MNNVFVFLLLSACACQQITAANTAERNFKDLMKRDNDNTPLTEVETEVREPTAEDAVHIQRRDGSITIGGGGGGDVNIGGGGNVDIDVDGDINGTLPESSSSGGGILGPISSLSGGGGNAGGGIQALLSSIPFIGGSGSGDGGITGLIKSLTGIAGNANSTGETGGAGGILSVIKSIPGIGEPVYDIISVLRSIPGFGVGSGGGTDILGVITGLLGSSQGASGNSNETGILSLLKSVPSMGGPLYDIITVFRAIPGLSGGEGGAGGNLTGGIGGLLGSLPGVSGSGGVTGILSLLKSVPGLGGPVNDIITVIQGLSGGGGSAGGNVTGGITAILGSIPAVSGSGGITGILSLLKSIPGIGAPVSEILALLRSIPGFGDGGGEITLPFSPISLISGGGASSGGNESGGQPSSISNQMPGGVNMSIIIDENSGGFSKNGLSLSNGGTSSFDLSDSITAFFESPLSFLVDSTNEGSIIGQLDSLRGISGERLTESIEAIVQSPLTLTQTLSGSIGLTIGGILGAISSPVTFSGSVLTNGVEGIFKSPVELVDTISANINLTANGVLGAVSSPLIIINQIIGGEHSIPGDLTNNVLHFCSGVNGSFLLSETITAILESPVKVLIGENGEPGLLPINSVNVISGEDIGETIKLLLESPLSITKTLSGGVGETVSGILGTFSSPVTICVNVLTGGIQGTAHSPGNAVDLLSANIDLGLNGVLKAVSSPLLHLLAIVGYGHSFEEGGIGPIESNLRGFCSGVNGTIELAESLTALLESPLRIFLDSPGDGGLLSPLKSFRAMSGDSLGGNIEALIESPFTVTLSLSGSVGATIAGILGAVSSPVALCGDILTDGIDGLLLSPEEALKILSGNIEVTLNGILGAVSSPLVLSNEIVRGNGSVIGNGQSNSNGLGLCGGVNGSFEFSETIAAFFESPFRIFVGVDGEGGILSELNSLKLVSGDGLGGSIKALIESPFTAGTSLSGGVGTTIGGILSLVSSPITISADVLTDGIEGVVTSPAEIVETLSGGISLTIDGILQAVSSPLTVCSQILTGDQTISFNTTSTRPYLTGLCSGVNNSLQFSEAITAFLKSPLELLIGEEGEHGILATLDSLKGVSGDLLGGGFEAIIDSPVTAVVSLSAGIGATTGGILGLVSSPLTLCGDFFTGGIDSIVNSPSEVVETICGSVSLTVNGIFEAVSSPLTISNDIITGETDFNTNITSGAGFPVIGFSNKVNASYEISEAIISYLESPFRILIGLDGEGGIISQLDSLKVMSGEQFGGGLEAFIISPLIGGLSLSGGIGATIGGILGLVSSPLTLSTDILNDGINGILKSPSEILPTVSGSLDLTVNGILKAVSSPLTISNEILTGDVSILGNGTSGGINGISGGLDGGVKLSETITTFLESPIKFLIGQDGLLTQLDSLKTISGFPGGIIEGIIDSPFIGAVSLSGGLGATIGGILSLVSSPVTLCGDILNDGFEGVINSPLEVAQSVSGSIQLTVGGIVKAASSPFTISSQILGGTGILANGSSGGVKGICGELSNGLEISESVTSTLESPLDFLIGVNGEGGLISHLDSLRSISGDLLGGGLEAFIESPVGLAVSLSGGVGLTVGGVLALVSSPVTVCGDILKDGIDGVANSPSEILDTVSGNLQLPIKGILGAISSPLTVCNEILEGNLSFGDYINLGLGGNSNHIINTIFESPNIILKPLCGGGTEILSGVLEAASSPLQVVFNFLTEGVAAQATSPLTIIRTLSGSLNLIVNGFVTVASSPLNPLYDIYDDKPGELQDSIHVAVNTIVDSPRETISTLSSGLGLTLAGIFGTVSSPVTLSSDIADMGLEGFIESPVLAFRALSGNIVTTFVGILQTVSSPLTISGDLTFNNTVDLGDQFEIKLPESLKDAGLDTSLESALKITSTISGNVDNTFNGILEVVSSPLSVSGEIAENGIISVISAPLLLTQTLSAGLTATISGIINGVSSPLTISSLLTDGHIYIDADGHVVIDGGTDLPNSVIETIEAIFQSPLLVLGPISGSIGITLEGILKTVSSPIDILHDSINTPGGIIQGITNSPMNTATALSGNLFTVFQGILQGAISPIEMFSESFLNLPKIIANIVTGLSESPTEIIETLSGSLDTVLKGIYDGVSSPLEIFFKDSGNHGFLGILESTLDLSLALSGAVGLGLTGILGATSSPLLLCSNIFSGIDSPFFPKFPTSPFVPSIPFISPGGHLSGSSPSDHGSSLIPGSPSIPDSPLTAPFESILTPIGSGDHPAPGQTSPLISPATGGLFFPLSPFHLPPLSGFVGGPVCKAINIALTPVRVLSGVNCHCET